MAFENYISADLIFLKLQLFSQCSCVALLLGAHSPWYSVNVPTLHACTLSRCVTVLSILQVKSLC